MKLNLITKAASWSLKRLLHNWHIVALSLLICIYIITFSTLSILRHSAFASNYDLANMSQTVWNTLNGRPFTLSREDYTISRFSIHADLILVFLTPFYLLWEKARMLLVIQSVVLGLGAIPVYFLSKKIIFEGQKINWKIRVIALVIATVYLLNPGLEWTNIYDFHGVSLAITFLLSAFYFAYTKKWIFYAFFIALALLTKEEISLYTAILGLWLFIFRKEKIMGIVTFGVSLLWFALMVFYVIPHASENGQYWALQWLQLSSVGSDNDLFASFKLIIYKFFLAADVIGYYDSLLRPFAYLPILGLPWLFFSLPELAINVLSSQAQMRSIFLHYDSGITPSLIIATIFGLKYAKQLINKIGFLKRYANLSLYLMVAALLVVALRVNYHTSPLPTTPSCWCVMYDVTEDDRQFERILDHIPRNAVVTSSSEIRAHLTQREHSYNLPSATESAEYIAIIDQNRIVGDYEPKEFENKLIKVLLQSDGHLLINHIGHFYLFKRK